MVKNKSQYMVIADAIKKDIKEGVLKRGDKLPTEKVLQERFAVSRMTVRQALQTLEKQKIVHIEKNRGAFVADIAVRRSKEIISMTEMMARMGITLKSEVLRLEKGVAPNDEVRNALQLKEDDEIYYLYRKRFSDSGVIAIEKAHIVAKYCPGLEMFNFEDFSLYDILFNHYKLKITWEQADITANMIYGQDAEMILNAKSGPALLVNNVVYDSRNVPIEYTKQIYNYKMFTYTVVSTEITHRYAKENN